VIRIRFVIRTNIWLSSIREYTIEVVTLTIVDDDLAALSPVIVN
jgi:hypothetical protein